MEASQMAVVGRIEQVMEETYKDVLGLQGDLVDINKKLLRPQPVAESEDSEKASPSGWFEEMLQRLTYLREKIRVIRRDESQRLKSAVAAGEVKRAE